MKSLAEVLLVSAMERTLGERLIDDALAAGYRIAIDDGSNWSPRTAPDKAGLLALMFAGKEDRLFYYRGTGSEPCGHVILVYESNGWDAISYWTPALGPVVSPADQLSNQLEEGRFTIYLQMAPTGAPAVAPAEPVPICA